MARLRKYVVVLIWPVLGFGQPVRHKTVTIRSQGISFKTDEYSVQSAARAVVILLSGSGGFQSNGIPYVDEARMFARMGYRVYLPDYLAVTRGRGDQPQLHYGAWALAVRDVLRSIEGWADISPRRAVIVGYSLGASVALALAAQEPDLAGVVVWNGSLPDEYREVNVLPPLLILHGGRDTVIPDYNARQLASICKLRRFKCQLEIFPDESHEFSRTAIKRAEGQIMTFIEAVLKQ